MKRLALTLVLAALAAAGCTLNRGDSRERTVATQIGSDGQIIQPKRCALQVAILSRPLKDEAIDDAVWRSADEQVLSPELRRTLEVNGLRFGVISGTLPAEVDAVLKAPPPRRVEPTQIVVPDGQHTMISLSPSQSRVSLLLNQEGRVLGKDYKDASGWYRITASHEGEVGVKLRFVPEIHHGPLQRAFSAIPNTGTYDPQQFMQKDGQQEETLRELTTTLTVQPGQIAVLGCRSDAGRSLGGFLFTQTEANSDRLLQKVVLIWASRSGSDSPGEDALPKALIPVDPPKS